MQSNAYDGYILKRYRYSVCLSSHLSVIRTICELACYYKMFGIFTRNIDCFPIIITSRRYRLVTNWSQNQQTMGEQRLVTQIDSRLEGKISLLISL